MMWVSFMLYLSYAWHFKFNDCFPLIERNSTTDGADLSCPDSTVVAKYDDSVYPTAAISAMPMRA